MPGDVVAEEEIDGGTQATATGDTIKLRTLGASDFSGAIITGIESLLMTSSVTGTFNGDQLRLGAITQVTGLASATQAIIVKDDDVNLRNVSFSNWGAATQTVTITGTSGTANTLIGSNQKDTINGFGSSADIMTGGGGADTLNGSNGPDTFVYVAATDVVAGETVSGGSNIDTLRFANTNTSADFSVATLTSIERFEFVSHHRHDPRDFRCHSVRWDRNFRQHWRSSTTVHLRSLKSRCACQRPTSFLLPVGLFRIGTPRHQGTVFLTGSIGQR